MAKSTVSAEAIETTESDGRQGNVTAEDHREMPPPIDSTGHSVPHHDSWWDPIKAWIRREFDMIDRGFTREDRERHNP